jgi:hypothetical protein
MKALLTLLLAFTLGNGSLVAQDGAKKEVVVFTRQMNQKSLDLLKAELADKGITLHYDDLRFGTEAQLEGISFTVKDASGRSFSASNDQLVRGFWFGFEFTYVGKSATLLNVGTLSEEAAPGVKP